MHEQNIADNEVSKPLSYCSFTPYSNQKLMNNAIIIALRKDIAVIIVLYLSHVHFSISKAANEISKR